MVNATQCMYPFLDIAFIAVWFAEILFGIFMKEDSQPFREATIMQFHLKVVDTFALQIFESAQFPARGH